MLKLNHETEKLLLAWTILISLIVGVVSFVVLIYTKGDIPFYICMSTWFIITVINAYGSQKYSK